jgi:hypothetical protein
VLKIVQRWARRLETCRFTLLIPKRLRPSIGVDLKEDCKEIIDALRERLPDSGIAASTAIEEATSSWWQLLFTMEAINRVLVNEKRELSPRRP